MHVSQSLPCGKSTRYRTTRINLKSQSNEICEGLVHQSLVPCDILYLFVTTWRMHTVMFHRSSKETQEESQIA
jgi:hypothetical protein